MKNHLSTVIREPARDIPVMRTCDVLVVGGGPAGCAAAASSARVGADTVLVERYGHLGGMSTGGLVIWIDRMTDWHGRHVITGFADELLDRMPAWAVHGPPKDAWGATDRDLVDEWKPWECAFAGTVTWSPTVDPELFKIVHNEIMQERGVKVLLHSWAVAPVQEDATVRGIIFESKSGRQAILAKVVIDATGDGEIFSLAGADFETDIDKQAANARMNVSFRLGGADFRRYIEFRYHHPEQYREIMARAAATGLKDTPTGTPRNDVIVCMGPRLVGYSCTDVEDLTAVEFESRRHIRAFLDFYHDNMPGFEDAWLLDTSSQLGVRHSRRLVGVKKVTVPLWTAGTPYDDEIGLTPPPSRHAPNVSIPLGCLIPARLEGLIAAGRNLSCDSKSHDFLREVPVCWVMGQGAGVAAAIAVKSTVRNVNMREVQCVLAQQGVSLSGYPEMPAEAAPMPLS